MKWIGRKTLTRLNILAFRRLFWGLTSKTVFGILWHFFPSFFQLILFWKIPERKMMRKKKNYHHTERKWMLFQNHGTSHMSLALIWCHKNYTLLPHVCCRSLTSGMFLLGKCRTNKKKKSVIWYQVHFYVPGVTSCILMRTMQQRF